MSVVGPAPAEARDPSEKMPRTLEEMVVESIAQRLVQDKSREMVKSLYNWRHPLALTGLPHTLMSQVDVTLTKQFLVESCLKNSLQPRQLSRSTTATVFLS